MTDYLKALAAAREAHTYVKHLGMTRAEAALGDLLAALDAQVPVAWRIFDGEGGYDFRDELPSENSRAWSARYGRKWEPLYAAPPAGYVPVSALIEARDHVEDWAAYSPPYFQEKHDLAGVLAEIDAQIAAAQAQQPAAAVPADDAIEAAYWDFDARHKGYGPHKIAPQSERDAFKWAVRAMLAAANKENTNG